jgi:LmbE family N-acetylglucosaminyl deacetylase
LNNEQLTLMAVHAHPDDEVFGTGGVFARAAALGMRTALVTATRGDVGEIHDP